MVSGQRSFREPVARRSSSPTPLFTVLHPRTSGVACRWWMILRLPTRKPHRERGLGNDWRQRIWCVRASVPNCSVAWEDWSVAWEDWSVAVYIAWTVLQ
eukprot:scaffold2331_cov252-Pinguiococcus_pyrenoidosus.AAC.5